MPSSFPVSPTWSWLRSLQNADTLLAAATLTSASTSLSSFTKAGTSSTLHARPVCPHLRAGQRILMGKFRGGYTLTALGPTLHKAGTVAEQHCTSLARTCPAQHCTGSAQGMVRFGDGGYRALWAKAAHS